LEKGFFTSETFEVFEVATDNREFKLSPTHIMICHIFVKAMSSRSQRQKRHKHRKVN